MKLRFSASWSLADRSDGSGTDSAYPHTATFSTATRFKPTGAPDISVDAIDNCELTSSTSTCATTISFSAPATLGDYSVDITPDDLGGPTGLAVNKLTINFTVAAPAAEARDTTLAVAKQCVLLNHGDADLTAKLEELDGGAPISSASIDFYIDPALANDVPTTPPIGYAVTSTDGIATLTHDVNNLAVGDYTLYAEFGGNTSYNRPLKKPCSIAPTHS